MITKQEDFIRKLIKEELDKIKCPNINDNFQKWFKNSKVINKSGKPIVCYHGSKSQNFNVFSKTTDIGFHFSVSKKIADDMCGLSEPDEFEYRESIKPLEVFLSVQNMAEIPDLEFWRKSDLLKALNEENEYRKYKKQDLMKFEYDISESLINNIKKFSVEYSELNIDYHQIDGFVYYNEYEGRNSNIDKTSIIVLNSNQIKSVNNDGSWDVNDDNIYS
jgi:hypothetical protein